jgi:23S rRNA pseudouridine1911/1915/1917 synthase
MLLEDAAEIEETPEDGDALPAEELAAAPDSEVSAEPAQIEQHFVVEAECSGWRLDRFLQKKMRRISRNRVQRIINGDCDVAGRPARPGMRVFGGQAVSFRRPAPPEPQVPRDISIVHHDPSFYVIEKPAGLPIHPTARYHFSTLTAVLRERFPEEQLQVAHRLDRETSGLMLVARDFAAASALKQAFARRQVQKRYLAIVHGLVEEDEFVLEKPIGPAGSEVRVRMAIRALDEGGQTARTAVTVLSRGAGYTLVECRPHTGRQHQIRVHLYDIGHPIVGDKLYPDEALFLRWAGGGDEAIKGELPLARHALHAAGLRFFHPKTGSPVEVSSPLPEDLLAFVAAQQMKI